MVQAGAHPITAIQYLLELQRDWARSETYVPVTNLVKNTVVLMVSVSSTLTKC